MDERDDYREYSRKEHERKKAAFNSACFLIGDILYGSSNNSKDKSSESSEDQNEVELPPNTSRYEHLNDIFNHCNFNYSENRKMYKKKTKENSQFDEKEKNSENIERNGFLKCLGKFCCLC